MSNIKLFDVQHSNDEYQNDLIVILLLMFNFQMPNVKLYECGTSKYLMFNIQMTNVKMI